MPILDWSLRRNGITKILPVWADFGRLRRPPRSLVSKVQTAVMLYPCDLLFIHRDAEAMRPEDREAEISLALGAVVDRPPAVRIVPVRMTEAWLLHDEAAIRAAAGNPNGQAALQLPGMATVETIPDPKTVLATLIRQASELSPNRLRRIGVRSRIHLVAGYSQGFQALEAVPAFARFAAELSKLLRDNQALREA